MSLRNYKLRFKNSVTDTVWTVTMSSPTNVEDADAGAHVSHGNIYELLEDTDLVADIKEIVDELLGCEMAISWNEKVLKITFDDCEDSDCVDAMEAIRLHIEDASGYQSEEPEEA